MHIHKLEQTKFFTGGRHISLNRLRLSSCRPRFESQAHHLCFYQFTFELCHMEKTKITEKSRELISNLKQTKTIHSNNLVQKGHTYRQTVINFQ